MIRRLCALLVRELSAFYYSPTAYVVLFFFLILNGLAFWFSIAPLSHGPSELTVVAAGNPVMFGQPCDPHEHPARYPPPEAAGSLFGVSHARRRGWVR